MSKKSYVQISGVRYTDGYCTFKLRGTVLYSSHETCFILVQQSWNLFQTCQFFHQNFRSKKILKLELAGNRAKIVTHHEKPLVIETTGPKIEMSSLISSAKSQSTSSVASSSSSRCSGSKHNVADLDLIQMYEKRNEQLGKKNFFSSFQIFNFTTFV